MNKTALTILISIVLTIILVSTVNVGTSLFFDEPEYNDFCEEPSIVPLDRNATVGEKAAYNEKSEECREEWDVAREKFNQQRYYVFAAIGFALLLVGLFHKENLIQITGLATGGILVFEGIVINLENKLIVFISLIAMLVIFGILGYRVVKKV
jgi:predicted cobalt transporter CbtA